jgi:hypothetical protein
MATFGDLNVHLVDKYDARKAVVARLINNELTLLCCHGNNMQRMSSSKTPTIRCQSKNEPCPLVIDGAALQLFYDNDYIKWTTVTIDGVTQKEWHLTIPFCKLCADTAGSVVTLSTFLSDSCAKYLSYKQPFWRCSCASSANAVKRAGTIIPIIGNPKLESSWNIDKVFGTSGTSMANPNKPAVEGRKAFNFSAMESA